MHGSSVIDIIIVLVKGYCCIASSTHKKIEAHHRSYYTPHPMTNTLPMMRYQRDLNEKSNKRLKALPTKLSKDIKKMSDVRIQVDINQ